MKKRAWYIAFFCIAASVWFFNYWIKPVIAYDNYYCAQVSAIAQSKAKLSYMEDWMNAKFSDPNFLKLLGKKMRIDLRGYPELINPIGINWDYLGLDKESAFISINRRFSDRERYMDARTIKSFTFGQGRFSVIIKVSGSDELGLEWPAKSISRLKQVDDNVFIDCD